MANLDQLQAKLGHQFRDAGLLKLALTHPSVAPDHGAGSQHNQRLEYLGDAVLQLVLTRALFERFPHFGEGPLTKARARLANRRFLADQARRLALGAQLTLSRGEEQQGGRDRTSALADAFEAVVGALFLDAGLDRVTAFILDEFAPGLAELSQNPSVENPKGELQELLQATSAEPPNYQLALSIGPDHDRVFESAVFHHAVELGRGRGRSKKEAESQAALEALTRLRSPVNPVGARPQIQPEI